MENTIVRHVLVCRFSPRMSTAQFAEFIDNFRALTEKIDGILSFEYGANNSPEGLDQGMTHVICLTFADRAHRDAYLTHPEHVRFARWFTGLGIVDSLLVVDYTPRE